MNASITNTCSSSIMYTNIIIAKKNLTKKKFAQITKNDNYFQKVLKLLWILL